ncbi:MAG: preprotein translocase subunit SecG [Sphingomonadales bacterium]|nr:preprotein translocase subunit SecG [Sphingomonadales bacterium]MDE2169981.1 preprotein translocase subunit SecG [Sphingomonadales bacterium]
MSSLFLFLTVVQALVTILLVVVILLQKSEGGGLGVGGSQAGFMSARGAADFMTRLTQILGGLFVLLSIVLAGLAVKNSTAQTVDDSLNRAVPTAAAPVPADALGKVTPGAVPPAAPSTAPAAPLDPLSGAAKK